MAALNTALLAAALLPSGSWAEAESSSPLPSRFVSVQAIGDPAGPSRGTASSLSELGYGVLPVPAGEEEEAYIEQLRASGLVLSAEPDVPVVAADSAPDDPLYEGFQAPYLAPLGAESAWDLVTGTGTVVIAILDTGIDLSHPDLQGRLWTNSAEVPGNGVDDDANGCVDDVYGCRFVNLTQERADACGYSSGLPTGSVQDDHGTFGSSHHSHGTIVAGIAGARGNNGKGVTGVGWNVRLMTVKVLDCGVPSQGGQASGDLTNVAQGIEYARRMGADIINVSLSTRDGVTDLAVLRSAVLAAQEAGVLIVAAAGNHAPGDSNVAPGFPAAYSADAAFPLVVAVGAADNTNGNSWATYSNYGAAIDFAAPGNRIASTTRSDLPPGTGYGIAGQGTSYATPIVSGLFALMMGRNSALPPSSYIDIAKATATPAAPAPHGENWAGAGIIDLGRALASIPMSVSGTAMHDWVDVDEGSLVVALVGTTECGRTATVSPVVGTFAVIVKSAAELAGCGTPGAEVTFTVGGLEAQGRVTWAGLNEDLGISGLEVTTVSPPPGPIVVQELGPGWNNIGHLGPTAPPPAALSYLPGTWEDVRYWRAEVGALSGDGAFQHYSRNVPSYANDLPLLPSLAAVWVELPAGATFAVANPDPPPGRAISLRAGWNNFVYTGTSRAVADALSDVDGLYEIVARFDNASGSWEIHAPDLPRFLNDFGGLMRLEVYWVYMTKAGVLTMR